MNFIVEFFKLVKIKPLKYDKYEMLDNTIRKQS